MSSSENFDVGSADGNCAGLLAATRAQVRARSTVILRIPDSERLMNWR